MHVVKGWRCVIRERESEEDRDASAEIGECGAHWGVKSGERCFCFKMY